MKYHSHELIVVFSFIKVTIDKNYGEPVCTNWKAVSINEIIDSCKMLNIYVIMINTTNFVKTVTQTLLAIFLFMSFFLKVIITLYSVHICNKLVLHILNV